MSAARKKTKQIFCGFQSEKKENMKKSNFFSIDTVGLPTKKARKKFSGFLKL